MIRFYFTDWTTLNVSVPPKQIPTYVERNEKREMADPIVMARKRKVSYCSSHKSSKRRPVKPVSGKFRYPYTFFEKKEWEKIVGKNIGNTKNCHWRFRTADNRILQRKLISTPPEFQKSHRRTCHGTKINWGGWAQDMWAPLRKHGNWRKA